METGLLSHDITRVLLKRGLLLGLPILHYDFTILANTNTCIVFEGFSVVFIKGLSITVIH